MRQRKGVRNPIEGLHGELDYYGVHGNKTRRARAVPVGESTENQHDRVDQ